MKRIGRYLDDRSNNTRPSARRVDDDEYRVIRTRSRFGLKRRLEYFGRTTRAVNASSCTLLDKVHTFYNRILSPGDDGTDGRTDGRAVFRYDIFTFSKSSSVKYTRVRFENNQSFDTRLCAHAVRT